MISFFNVPPRMWNGTDMVPRKQGKNSSVRTDSVSPGFRNKFS